MTKMNKKKTISLALVAMVLIATLNIGNALAYFTDFTSAIGNKPLELGFAETDFYEEIEPGKKVIWIQNTGEYPGYVRMKALAGKHISFKYEESNALKPAAIESYTIKAGSWSLEKDGYYYYSAYLLPEECTKPIEVTFNQPSDVESYNVIVVQECTPVLYDNDGKEYAAWDATMMSSPDDTTKGPTSELK